MIRSLLTAFVLAASLTGCSAGQLSEKLEQLPPSLGGMPANTPPPPANSYQYPAVHEMPVPRLNEPLSEDQQWKLEQELNAVRDRQEGVKPKAAVAQPRTAAKPWLRLAPINGRLREMSMMTNRKGAAAIPLTIATNTNRLIGLTEARVRAVPPRVPKARRT